MVIKYNVSNTLQMVFAQNGRPSVNQNFHLQGSTKDKYKHVLPQNLYMRVHGRIIHNSQNMETTEMFTIDEWIPSVVYMYNGILFYDKTE